MATVKQQFDAAVKVIQSLPKNGGTFQPSTTMMLTFYALYKQGTQGVCNTSRPAFYDIVGRAKWDAWKQLGCMTTDEAMKGYVNELKKHLRNDKASTFQIVETMPQTEIVQEFLEQLGNFYEMVDEEESHTGDRRQMSNCSNECYDFTHLKRRSGDDCRASPAVPDLKVVHESNKLNGGHPSSCIASKSGVIHMSAERVYNGSVQGRTTNCLKTTEELEIDVINEQRTEENASTGSTPLHYHDDDGDENDVSSSSEDVSNDDDKSNRAEEHIDDRMNETDNDDEEFCDTSDMLFVQDKSLKFFQRSSDASVQTLSREREFRQRECESETGERIYLKIHKAMEEMQKNIEEVQNQLRKLEEINSRKVKFNRVLDVFRFFNIPTLCFVIFWPIVVNIFFRHISRSKRKAL